MFFRKERRKPFQPSASYKGLSKEPKQLKPLEDEDIDEKRQKFIPGQKFYDAETGEEISLTHAKWSSKEGRLDLDANTILNMGTGKLDISVKAARARNATTAKNEDQFTASKPSAAPTKLHPLVQQFLEIGPLTPMFNKNWNIRTNKIEQPDIESLDSIPIIKRVASPINKTSIVATNNSMGTMLTLDALKDLKPPAAVSAPLSPVIPPPLQRKPTINVIKPVKSMLTPGHNELELPEEWNSLLEKTYCELYDIAEKLEINKSLTLEDYHSGGIATVRKLCRSLAKMRVRHMKEIMAAVDDELEREQKREAAEEEYAEKEDVLKALKVRHRDERARGKLYINALQRDQEIVFMSEMRKAGLLW